MIPIRMRLNEQYWVRTEKPYKVNIYTEQEGMFVELFEYAFLPVKQLEQQGILTVGNVWDWTAEELAKATARDYTRNGAVLHNGALCIPTSSIKFIYAVPYDRLES